MHKSSGIKKGKNLSQLVSRRSALLGVTGSVLAATIARAQAVVQPRITIISQWSSGTTGRAMNKIGELFTQAGGKWEHSPVPGFTYDMMNKLRADIMAGTPPAASQLKGPEIAAWSKIAPTVDLDPIVEAAAFAEVCPEELIKLHKPFGHWIALPLQIYRVNSLWVSKKAADRIGMTKIPTTWEEYNTAAEKMKASGIIPISYGGLAGQSPSAYRKAIMELDDNTLRGAQVLAAFRQLRRMTGWMNPANPGQHWSVFTPRFMAGKEGMLLMGNWAQGSFSDGGFKPEVDYLVGPAPSDDGDPAFDLNADAFIFWKQHDQSLQAGQRLLAKIVIGKQCQIDFSKINGSIPVRTDVELGVGFSDQQRETSQHLLRAIKTGRVVLSLAHNMAQTDSITGAMVQVLTEFVHNNSITPEKGQTMLAEAVAREQ
jgi:glucose/mannose transport system substrate-binding protein